MNRYVACTAYCQILSTFSHIQLVHVWFKRIYFKFINIHGVKNTYQNQQNLNGILWLIELYEINIV